ncbi:uncharacterized protein LOC135684301 [Rhopilema esculentum]|uniref:uncharacterized protein LOC135684301 n=1 Tax=Rhopilema esculentum TaxID=499914 RepID=UPI0031DDB607|eukprot:gene16603-8030_t
MEADGSFVGLAYDYGKYPKIVAVHSKTVQEPSTSPDAPMFHPNRPQFSQSSIVSLEHTRKQMSSELQYHPSQGRSMMDPRRHFLQSMQYDEALRRQGIARNPKEGADFLHPGVTVPFPPTSNAILRMQFNHYLQEKHKHKYGVNYNGYWVTPVDSVSFKHAPQLPYQPEEVMTHPWVDPAMLDSRYFPQQPAMKRQKLTHDIPFIFPTVPCNGPVRNDIFHDQGIPGLNVFPRVNPDMVPANPVFPHYRQGFCSQNLPSEILTDNLKRKSNHDNEIIQKSASVAQDLSLEEKYDGSKHKNFPSQISVKEEASPEMNIQVPYANNGESNAAYRSNEESKSDFKSRQGTNSNTHNMSELPECKVSTNYFQRSNTAGQDHPDMSSEFLKILRSKEYNKDFTRLLLLENKGDLLEVLRYTADHSRASLLFVVRRLLSRKCLENALILLENIKKLDLTEKAKEKVLSVVQEKIWGYKPRLDLWEKPCESSMEARCDVRAGNTNHDQVENFDELREKTYCDDQEKLSNFSEEAKIKLEEKSNDTCEPFSEGESNDLSHSKKQGDMILETVKKERVTKTCMVETDELIAVANVLPKRENLLQGNKSDSAKDECMQVKEEKTDYTKEEGTQKERMLKRKTAFSSVCQELEKRGEFSKNELKMIKVMEENIEELSSGITLLNEEELELLGRVVVHLDECGNVVIKEEICDDEYSNEAENENSNKYPVEPLRTNKGR